MRPSTLTSLAALALVSKLRLNDVHPSGSGLSLLAGFGTGFAAYLTIAFTRAAVLADLRERAKARAER